MLKPKAITNLYLDRFLKYTKQFDDLYMVKKDEFSKEWIEKKIFIAKSLLSLYRFANDLILDKFYNSKEARFYAFYLDLIMSKMKHSIFTEIPKSEIIDVHTLMFREDIIYTAERLLEYDSKDELFNIEYQRFIFKIYKAI
jgi:hypothetical protein